MRRRGDLTATELLLKQFGDVKLDNCQIVELKLNL